MEHVLSWLQRLRDLEKSKEKPVTFHENLLRAVVPGHRPLMISDCMIASSPAGPANHIPGDCTPSFVSVLRLLDSVPQNTIEIGLLGEELATLFTLATGIRTDIPIEIPLRVKDSNVVTFVGFGDAADRRLSREAPENCTDSFLFWLRRIASLGNL